MFNYLGTLNFKQFKYIRINNFNLIVYKKKMRGSKEIKETTIYENKDESDNNNFYNEMTLMKRVSEYVSKHDFMFRICIVGDANVGKTSLLTRYCDNVFKETYNNTIGVDFRVVTLQYNNQYTKIHVWDTAGQERFKSISVNYFRSTHGFMFMFDVTNKTSFNNLNSWIEMAYGSNKSTAVNFLVGNKTDLDNREVTEEEGKSMAERYGFSYLETSAKKNQNVDIAFQFFALKLINYYSKNKNDYEKMSANSNDRLKMDEVSKSLDLPQKKKKKCGC